MPLLIGLIGPLVSFLVRAFVVISIKNFVVFASIMTLLYVALNEFLNIALGYVATLTAQVTVPPFLPMFIPSNLSECITIIISVKVAGTLFNISRSFLEAKLGVSLMPVYAVTGKLGAGKTLVAVGRIQTYLNEKRKVATNLDLNLEFLIQNKSKNAVVYRIPDVPSIKDFKLIGRGYEGPIQGDDSNGLVVLDECAKWLNSRAWNDKSRKELIDYFVHLRKLRWDLILIIQDINALDKQFRDLYCEHIVYCSRSDRFNIPFIGAIYKTVTGSKLPLPRVHIGAVFYVNGSGQDSRVETWITRGTALYEAYDTEQGFNETTSPETSTYLPPYYTTGRYLDGWNEIKKNIKSIKATHLFFIGVLFGGTLLNAMTPDGESPNAGIFTCNKDWKVLFGSCDVKKTDVENMLKWHNSNKDGEAVTAPQGFGSVEPSLIEIVDHPITITASVLIGNQYEYYFVKGEETYFPSSEGYQVIQGKYCNALLVKKSDRDITKEVFAVNYRITFNTKYN